VGSIARIACGRQAGKLIEYGQVGNGRIKDEKMTDNPNESTNDNSAEQANFTWWLCMVPALAGCGIFFYLWLSKHDPSNLGWAVGSLVAGVFIALLVDSGSAGAEDEPPAAGGNTDKKH
jgi:hypothetical protein